jgi:hypothetical protein
MVSLRILSCSQSGDHPENNLAKFGYMLDMKVEKKRTISMLSRGYLLEVIIKFDDLNFLASSKSGPFSP